MRAALPNPATGWEAFASDRLEWNAQAAVRVDLLYITYACWCASHGAPVLPEDEVLAWLTAHGVTARLGALSQVAAVEGVQVVD